MIIPEETLRTFAENYLSFMKYDIENNSETDTFLYRTMYGNSLGRINLYTELKELFLRSPTHPRRLEIRNIFDPKDPKLPAIYINLPAEFEKNNEIAQGLHYVMTDTEELIQTKRRFGSVYSFNIISNNRTEVLSIYHTLRSFFLAVLDHIQNEDIEVPKLSGKDLNINSNLIPGDLFVRSLNLEFEYEVIVPELIKSPEIAGLVFNGTPYISE